MLRDSKNIRKHRKILKSLLKKLQKAKKNVTKILNAYEDFSRYLNIIFGSKKKNTLES